MPSTFRNPTAMAAGGCVLVLALAMAAITMPTTVSGKSIIRELMETPGLAPDGKDGRTISRPGRQFDEFPIEQCRITQTKPELSTKLNRLCDECYQTYRVPNFYVQCRARCYDNVIIQGCALALYRKELMTELENFIKSADFKIHGMTMAPPTEKNGGGSGAGPTASEIGLHLLQLQKSERS